MQGRQKAYHLQPLLQRSSTLQVLGSGLNVPVNGLLGQVNHVGGEKRLAMGLEVALVLVEQAVQPWQQLLGAVVGVEDDGDAVGWGNAADVVGAGNGTGDGSLLVSVGDALSRHISILIVPAQPWKSVERLLSYLSSKVGSAALGELEDDGAVLFAGGFQSSDDSRRRSHVLSH